MAARSKRSRRRPESRDPRADPPVVAETPLPELTVAEASLASVGRADALDALGVAAAAAVLFWSTFSTHVALGDAPESVAGVKSVGVLHAPGYPSYVAVANVFARIVALGGWAARVNGFSVLCAALMIAAVHLLCRGFGASRAGAALGALALATTASFWFNAALAKHYAMSGLLVTLAALAVVQWQAKGRSWLLIVAAAMLGACAGASWELAAIMGAGLVVLVIFGPRRASMAVIGAAAATMTILTVAAYGFVMWRAGTHPAVNWGEANSVHRVVTLVSQQDFRKADPNNPDHGNLLLRMAARLPDYLGIVARDIGLGAVVAVLVGAAFGAVKLSRDRKIALAAVAVLNFIAVVYASTGPPSSSAVAGNRHISGFLTGIVAGGYLIDLFVVLAVLAAIGFAPMVEWASRYTVRRQTPARDRSRPGYDEGRYRSTFAAALFAIVLIPSIVVHYSVADHRQAPFADLYARRLFSELPAHAVVFVYEADLTFPLVYRQAVFGDRPDVGIVIATNLQFDWYREQVTRDLHLRSPLRAGDFTKQIPALITELGPTRPAFLDTGVMRYLPSTPVRLHGLVGEVVASRAEASINRTALAAALLRADHADRIFGHADAQFPNGFIHYLYARAHVELAKDYARAHELEPARTELARSTDDYPDSTTSLVVKFLGQSDTTPAKAEQIILGL